MGGCAQSHNDRRFHIRNINHSNNNPPEPPYPDRPVVVPRPIGLLPDLLGNLSRRGRRPAVSGGGLHAEPPMSRRRHWVHGHRAEPTGPGRARRAKRIFSTRTHTPTHLRCLVVASKALAPPPVVVAVRVCVKYTPQAYFTLSSTTMRLWELFIMVMIGWVP